MKRKKLWVTGLVLALGFAVIFATSLQKNKTDIYLKHISKIGRTELKGPDKSTFRDAIMTMNPSTGEINRENIRDFLRDASKARLRKNSDFGWEQIDTDIAGRVRKFMIDPNDPNKLWAGAVTGGLWYSSDFRNGTEWVPVSDNWESLSIGSIAYDPNNTQTFYVGTGESYTSVNIYRESTSSGVGIYKTTDGGSSWNLLSSTEGFEYVNDIVVSDEDGTSVIYAGVASGIYQGNTFDSTPTDGLYRSNDGGDTWTQVLPNIEGEDFSYAVSDIELTNSGALFVGTMRNLTLDGGGMILISSDGINWELEDRYVEQGMTDYGESFMPGRVVLASGGDIVYALATGGFQNNFNQIRDSNTFLKLMRYAENSWSDLDDPLGTWASIPWHALAITVDPTDPNRVVVGGLDAHALSDATAVGSLSWIEVSDWISMYHFSDYLKPYYGLTDSDSMLTHFVHADIHQIEFLGNSDEILFSNDGGLHYSSDFSKSFEIPTGERLDQYASFQHINHSFATTQYYTVALRPGTGSKEVLAGSQDNSTHTTEDGRIDYSHMIGGGDGAYCFFDADDPDLRITASQSNAYNIWINDVGNFYGFSSGTFINPAEYDDRSNLLYANMAVDGGFEALITSNEGKYLDTLGLLNINQYLGKDMLGLELFSYITLGTNSTAAFSALKVSPHDDPEDVTMIIGNQLGDVYRVEGLPNSPDATKIDNEALPVGYISAIDIGDTNDNILVSFSNYGVQSVWHSQDGGENWTNLDRNLPDIPVRHAMFNPVDDKKILVATEIGVWGLENLFDESSEWVSYDDNFPNVRVDMIDARASDSTIVAATHGRGLFIGKFDQGGNEVPEANFVMDISEIDYKERTFDASSSLDLDGEPIYFEWDFGDGNSGNGEAVVHTYDSDGTYEVTLNVTDGTESDEISQTIIVAPLGLTDHELGVYPNPTSGILNIEEDAESIKLFSIQGRFLQEISPVERTLDISAYENGIYFIQLETKEGKLINFKVIKN